jgi:NAD(P)-dependent dehydrogenase (short-subunit alcohol dehydrogenase family)
MYHPAAALHQASLRDTLFRDMRGLPGALLDAREAIAAERAATVEAEEATVTAVVASRALKRDAYPEDLLGALVFLASSDSDFISGQVIAVDGGIG